MYVKNGTNLCIELLLFATVLEGLFREYHSSLVALGQQRPETKSSIVIGKSTISC